MKKWLPIIMLASAVVVPSHIAEASYSNNTTKPVEVQFKVINQLANGYLGGEVKGLPEILNFAKDGKITEQEVSQFLNRYTNKELTNQLNQVNPVKQHKEMKKEVIKEKPAKQKMSKPAPKQKAPMKKPVAQAPVNNNNNNNTQTTPAPSKPVAEAKPTTQGVSAIEQAVLNLTNKERTNAGLKPLQIDTPLMNSARDKSTDMASKGYFSHNSPTLGSPFDQMKANGITYRAAAENIAMGQRSAEEVVNGWMNSPGHRANIMNPSFTHIGIGYNQNGNYWTQQFIQK